MKNTLLRMERRRKGWTQLQLAVRAEVSLSTVERAERGEPVRLDNIQRLCACLGKEPEQLGLLQTEDEDVNRREASKKIAGLVGGLLVSTSQDLLQPPLWERISRALTQSSNVDTLSLQGLEQITKSYWQLRSSIGYRGLLSGFLGHLEVVEQLLRCPQSPTTRQRLCAIASEIAQRIGAINFDIGDYATAKAYYRVSIEAAKEADNHMLWVVGLGRMSSLPIYNDNPRGAIPLLQEAQKLATQHIPGAIRAWLASIEAEAHANLHDEQSCMLMLGRAESSLEMAERDDIATEVKFDYSRLVGYKGTCFLRLQKADMALEALSEGAKSIDTASMRQRAIIVADTATAYMQLGEIDTVCKFAVQALELNEVTKSNLVLQRLRKLRTDIEPWKDIRSVKDFDEQMALRIIVM